MDDVLILYQVFSLLYDSQGSRKKNPNMINDTTDSCNSGKICSHRKTHRNSFGMMNCQGD